MLRKQVAHPDGGGPHLVVAGLLAQHVTHDEVDHEDVGQDDYDGGDA